MTIYIVSKGERSEGSNVVSLHSSLESAIRAAMAVEPVFNGGWIEESIGGMPNLHYYAENVCDYVKVTSKELE